MFENLKIKIVVPTSSEMMPKLFQYMTFVKNMEIDLNNKTIDFYEFPSQAVTNIRQLSFKKHSFNFEKLVELFEQIESLKIKAEEFTNIKQNLVRQKKLRKVSIICNYQENQTAMEGLKEIYNGNTQYSVNYTVQIDSKFGLTFYDSSVVDLEFTFLNSHLELSNILYHFAKLACKSTIVSVDNLVFNYSQRGNLKPLPYQQEFSHQLCQFIDLIEVKDERSKNSSTFMLKEFTRETEEGGEYVFRMTFRQALMLYDNNSMPTYLNPIQVRAKAFEIKF